METVGRPVYWVINEDQLMEMLNEVAQGSDPEAVYMEHYANSEVEDHAQDG